MELADDKDDIEVVPADDVDDVEVVGVVVGILENIVVERRGGTTCQAVSSVSHTPHSKSHPHKRPLSPNDVAGCA